MTHAVRHPQPLSRNDCNATPHVVARATANDEARISDDPAPRSVVTRVTGALDGVMRVVTVLRARGYVVRDLSVDVQEALGSEIRATVVVTGQQVDLLLERLRRLPVVVDARADDL